MPDSKTTKRILWILGTGSLDGTLLGPVVRLVEMAHQAVSAGLHPILALEQATPGSFETLEVQRLDRSTLRKIRPGDAVVCSYFLHPRTTLELCNSGIPFDVDMYGVHALEHMEVSHGGISDRRIFQSRRRVRRRYRLLIERAEKIYLSNPQQLTFLGGLLFADGTARSCRLASRLPERTLFLPMGTPRRAQEPQTNPYPPSFQGRPVFLWGGGIWKWFDLQTLLKAFALLRQRGSSAALYFLCGTNLSASPDHDAPVRQAYDLAQQYDLLGESVAFHDGGVQRADLPKFLEHCTAGIMTNPDRLESIASWRTRLLDLPPYGKPVVTSGFDPLSAEFHHAGFGLLVPGGDAPALADAIETLCSDPSVLNEFESRSLDWANRNSWDALFAPWRERLQNRDAFVNAPKPVSWWDVACYFAGI